MNNLINKAIKQLSKDIKLKSLIDKNEKPFFEENNNYYHALSKSIIYQQLSGKVAKIIYNRFLDLFNNKQPKANSRGDFEDAADAGFPNVESATTLEIPSIDVKMKSEAIVAKTRKLKAQWTPEFAQDLNAYQALDAEAELTSIMSEYISLEIDLEILDMLMADSSAKT